MANENHHDLYNAIRAVGDQVENSENRLQHQVDLLRQSVERKDESLAKRIETKADLRHTQQRFDMIEKRLWRLTLKVGGICTGVGVAGAKAAELLLG